MAENNRTGGGVLTMNSNSVHHQNPTRRSGRNRKSRPLSESFKEIADSTPQKEMDDLTNELNFALGAIAASTSNQQLNSTTGSAGLGLGLRRTGSKQQQQAATSAGRMLLGRPGRRTATADDEPNMARGISSTGRLSSNSRRAHRGTLGAAHASCAAIIPRWSANYTPKSSSRRNSRAGSELSLSMKMSAQKALADLGEVTDDDEDDEDWLKLSLLKDENMSGIIEGV